jgi:hypothetical protein
MAKDIDLDSFDLDDLDFGGDEFLPELDSGGKKKDRNPVEAIKRGAVQGAKDTVVSPEFRRKLVKESLPESYSVAYDGVSDGIEFGRDLYDTTARELAPARRAFRKITKRLLPAVDSILPEGISKRLKSFSESTDDVDAAKMDWQQMEIDSQLNDIFKTQMEHQQYLASDQEQRDLAAEVIEDKRHHNTIGLLDVIRRSGEKVVAFQNTVLTGYQRKHLELQYRSLFTQQDLLSEFKDYKVIAKDALASITKNTGLPDFVKMRLGETSAMMLRERIIGDLQQDAAEFLNDYLPNFKKNILKAVGEKAKGFASNVTDVADAIELAGESGVDAKETVGSVAGGFLTQKTGEILAKFIRPLTTGNNSIMGVGADAEYAVKNAPTLIREKLEQLSGKYGDRSIGITTAEDDVDEDGRPIERSIAEKFKRNTGSVANKALGVIADTLLEVAPQMKRVDTVGLSKEKLLEENFTYNALADKAITQIIPGLLTEILHVNERMLTGDDTVKKLQFNFNRDEFTRSDVVKADIMEEILPAEKLKNVRESINALIDQLDPSGTLLSPKARSELGKQFISDMAQGYGFSLDRYLQPDRLDNVAQEYRQEIISAIATRFMDGDKVKKDASVKTLRNKLANDYKRIIEDVPNVQRAAALQTPFYGTSLLKDLGILNEGRDGRSLLNRSAFSDYVIDDKRYAPRPSALVPARQQPLDAVPQQPVNQSQFDLSGLGSRLDSMNMQLSVANQYLEGVEGLSGRVDMSNLWLEEIYTILNGWGKPPPTPPTGPGSGPQSPPPGPDGGPSVMSTLSSQVTTIKDAMTKQFDNLAAFTKEQKALYDELAKDYGHQGALELLADDAMRKGKSALASGVSKVQEYVPTQVKEKVGSVTTQITEKITVYKELVDAYGPKAAAELILDDAKRNGYNALDVIQSKGSQVKDSIGSTLSTWYAKADDKFDLTNKFDSLRKDYALDEKLDSVKGMFNEFKDKLPKFELPDSLKEKEKELQSLISVFGKEHGTAMFVEGIARDTRAGIEDKWSKLTGTFKDEKGDFSVQSSKQNIIELKDELWRKLDDQALTLRDSFDAQYKRISGDDSVSFNQLSDSFVSEIDRVLEELKSQRGKFEDTQIGVRLKELFGVDPNKEASNDEQLVKASLIERIKSQLGEFDAAAKANSIHTSMLQGFESVKSWFDGVRTGEAPVVGTSLGGTTPPTDTLTQALEALREEVTYLKEATAENTQAILAGGVAGVGGALAANESGFVRRNFGAAGELAGKGVGLAKRGTMGLLRFTGKAYAATFKLAGKGALLSAKLGVKAAGAGLSGARNIGLGLLGKSRAVSDIYLKGEQEPVITAKQLKEGEFVDADGKPIHSFDDIKGPVYDKEGNLVIKLEDIEQNRLIAPTGEPIGVKIGQGIRSAAFAYGRFAATGYGALFKAGRSVFTFAKERIFGVVNRPTDVYVKGEETPRLLKILMERGLYRDKVSGDVIKTIRDIKGEVIDNEGNVVISVEDLKKGLIGPDGRKFKALGGFLKSAATKTVGLVKSVYSTAFKAAGTVLGGGFRIGKRAVRGALGLPPEASVEAQFEQQTATGVGKSNDVLNKIYALLNDRIPKPNRIRKGSWQDIFSKRKNEDDEARRKMKDHKGHDKSKSLLGKLGGGLAALFGLGEGKGILGGLGDMFGGGGDGFVPEIDIDMDGRNRGPTTSPTTPQKKPGRIRRAGGALKRGAGSLARGAGSLARGAGGLAAGAGRLALAAAPLAVTAGSALASGAAAAASTGAAAIGAVIASPLLLPGLAVAATAAGGYALWRYFDGKPNGDLHTYRLTQYGIDSTDGDMVRRINSIESTLEDYVYYDKDTGQANLSRLDDDDLNDIIETCGIQPDNAQHVDRFAKWFETRFKPVYLTHLTVLNQIDKSADLDDLDDDLSEEDKKRFFLKVADSTHLKSAYSELTSPFVDMERQTLTKGIGDVQNMEKSLKTSLIGSEKSLANTTPQKQTVKSMTSAPAPLLYPFNRSVPSLNAPQPTPSFTPQTRTLGAATVPPMLMMAPPKETTVPENESMDSVKMVGSTPVNPIPGVGAGSLSAMTLGMNASSMSDSQLQGEIEKEQQRVAMSSVQTQTANTARSNQTTSSMRHIAEILTTQVLLQTSMDRSLRDIRELLLDPEAAAESISKRSGNVSNAAPVPEGQVNKAVQNTVRKTEQMRESAPKSSGPSRPPTTLALDR